jgi:hypothetical protein
MRQAKRALLGGLVAAMLMGVAAQAMADQDPFYCTSDQCLSVQCWEFWCFWGG